MARLLLLNGPNLNLLGSREPAIYGGDTLTSIEERLIALADKKGHVLSCFQSNAEHELIERIQACVTRGDLRTTGKERAKKSGTPQLASPGADFVIFNPGGFTHTSVALRDALLAVKVPFIEVHLSNIHARESFRRQSYFSDIAAGSIVGLGPVGYELALYAAIERIEAARPERS